MKCSERTVDHALITSSNLCDSYANYMIINLTDS